jgi:DNA polymerase-1
MQLFGVDYYPQELGAMRVIRDPREVESVVRFVSQAPVRVFDTETSGLRWWGPSHAVGVGLGAWDSSGVLRSYYLPFRHRTGEPQLPEDLVVRAVGDVLAVETGLTVGHNLKFDEHMGRQEGWIIRSARYDTMVGSALYDENHKLALDERAKLHLGIADPCVWDRHVHDEVERLAKARRMTRTAYMDVHAYEEVPINCLGIYCCHDIYHAGMLHKFFEDRGLSAQFARVWRTEMELVRILGNVEARGLPIDAPYLMQLSARLGEFIEVQRRRWVELVGTGVDPSSDDDVRHLVYDVYRMPGYRTTRTGKLSVEADVLEGFRDRVPSLGVLLALRTAEKIRGTYCEGILSRLDSKGYVHPSFWQVGTNTGRLSCSEPNFQNMPTEDPDREKAAGGIDPWSIRRAFVVPDPQHWVRWYFDYSQVELRVLAKYSMDPIMVEVYQTGGDIHERTQREVSGLLGKPIPRRDAKVVNFGLSFCLTAAGLARQTGMSMPDAEAFLGAFFARYGGVSLFRSRLWAQMRAHPQCVVTNLWGRPRRLPMLRSRDKGEQRRAERQAIGSLIQGTAAELTKESMVRIDRLERSGYPIRMVNTVHDEIQIDIDVRYTAEMVTRVKREMEDYHAEMDPIPIIAEADYAVDNWASKQKVKAAA